jgi:hypothetical protein
LVFNHLKITSRLIVALSIVLAETARVLARLEAARVVDGLRLKEVPELGNEALVGKLDSLQTAESLRGLGVVAPENISNEQEKGTVMARPRSKRETYLG